MIGRARRLKLNMQTTSHAQFQTVSLLAVICYDMLMVSFLLRLVLLGPLQLP